MSHTFNYVKYDESAVSLSEAFKKKFEELEVMADAIACGRSKALVRTKLEEAFMWVGKGIRNDQIGRNSLVDHVAERTNE